MEFTLQDFNIEKITKVTLSAPSKENEQYIKVMIRPINEARTIYQVESFTKTQAFHMNLEIDVLEMYLRKQFGKFFKQMTIHTDVYEHSFKLTKKNKLLSNKKKSNLKNVTSSHNKVKKYILNEGDIIPPLIDLGVMTDEGKIIKKRYDKFRQINKFIEIIDDTLKDYDKESISIIDFGCGKSYLTFVLYHYLVNIKKVDAHIVGLDLKKKVIEDCNQIAEKYQYDNLKFQLGDIKDYQTTDNVDMVITLHACDVATDLAIYNAINWNAQIILSVPCCQHEINGQIDKELNLFTKFGLSKERYSALLTDNIRASLLESQGYKVDVMEFIDMSHTPKNILIRAKYNAKKNLKSLKEVEATLEEHKITQTLHQLLNK